VESGAIRRKGLKPRLWMQLLYFSSQPRLAHRNPPCKFLGGCSCKVQLILRRCLSSQGKAWHALHISS